MLAALEDNLLDCLPLGDGVEKLSVTNYQYTLRNIQEEWKLIYTAAEG